VANRYDDKVASVSKALTIVEVLSQEPEGMGLVEISNHVGMNKTTVYRLLTSLMEKEFVEQDEKTGKYSLGLKILSIATALYEKMDIRAIVRKHVQEQLDGFQGTLLVTKEMNRQYVVADCICLGQEPLWMAQEGEILEESPVIRKMFLANAVLWQPGRNMLTMQSFHRDQDLKQELKQIALQGYAESMDDLGGIPAVAAPVFNFSKNVVYVLSLHSPVLKERKTQSEWILAILRLANQISNDLGFVNYI